MENARPFHLQLRYERELRGWSQAELAEKVGSDEKTVSRWENNDGKPRPYLRKRLYALFNTDGEKMGLLKLPATPNNANASVADIESTTAQTSKIVDEVAPSVQRQEDWGEALRFPLLYGRENERAQLLTWIQQDRCRVVAVLGIGGVGKTTLLSAVAEQGKVLFGAVFWRSLQNALPPEQFMQSAIQFLSRQQHTILPATIDDLVPVLVQTLQSRRCLLILDNFESVLQAGQRTGQYQPGYEGYGKLLQRVGEAQHESCLLLTSREKPKEIAHMESKQGRVRTLNLDGIGYKEGQELLQEKELVGNERAWSTLVRMYSGNPLALKLVGQSIREVFGGRIENFLAAEESVFGDVTDLLHQQFQRLSAQEQDVLTWLAIEREAVALETLREDILQPVSGGALIETLESLRQRSLIETREPALFTLQPVVMEYLTTRLVQQAVTEFLATGERAGSERAGRPQGSPLHEGRREHVGETLAVSLFPSKDVWNKYAFIKAQTQDYVRTNQIRLLLMPIAQRILTEMSKEAFEEQVRHILDAQRTKYIVQRAYVAGNLLNLLVYLDYDLHSFDFSHLTIRQAYLQDATLTDANFTSAHFLASVFTNTFGNVLSVAFSPDGSLLAVGIATGELWLYDVASGTPLFSCTGHTDGVWAVAFSPDMRLLASSSDDASVRLWSVETGDCVNVLMGHTDRVRALAFHPDGKLLASGSDDRNVLLWEVQSGLCLNTLQGHIDRVWSVAFSHDGGLLASGSTDSTIRLWDVAARSPLLTLTAHANGIRSLAFSPNDQYLVSGSDDKKVMLWEVQSGICTTVFYGHTNRVWSVDFSADGQTIASGSEDQTICLWNILTGERVQTLQGHIHGVRCVAYSKNGLLLASGGDDQTIRFWETPSGRCLKILQGYTNRIRSIVFVGNESTLASIGEDQAIRVWDMESAKCTRTMREQGHGLLSLAATADGTLLASGGEDQTVRVWNPVTGQRLKTLRGHTNWVGAVAFSPDGRMLVSGSEDRMVRLWETSTGRWVQTLEGHKSWVRAVSFSPDGRLLASAGDDQTIRLWQPGKKEACLLVLEGHTARIRSLAFHPNGHYLISGSEDATLRIWDTTTGDCILILEGHTGRVRSVAYSANGSIIGSGSDDQTVRLWDCASGECLKVLQGHTNRVRWIAFALHGEQIVSSSDDGTIKLWDTQTASCLKTLLNERPYERMNITDVQGLTETQKATLRLLGAVEDA